MARQAKSKSDWISHKILKLRSEGKPQTQAVAIAHQMWRDRQRRKKRRKK